jgi:hypothetical protein
MDDEMDIFYDAIDYSSDENDDNDDDVEQAPDDGILGPMIKFTPLSVYNNSEPNEVEYFLPPNYGN